MNLTIEITPKEYQLIMFMRNDFKYGKCELIVHAGQPQKVVIKEPEIHFKEKISKKDLTSDFNLL